MDGLYIMVIIGMVLRTQEIHGRMARSTSHSVLFNHAGSNFTYEVIVSDEEGTIWWHAHSEWTRASVHGAIVVFPVNGTTRPFPEPDEEEILVLGMLPLFSSIKS